MNDIFLAYLEHTVFPVLAKNPGEELTVEEVVGSLVSMPAGEEPSSGVAKHIYLFFVGRKTELGFTPGFDTIAAWTDDIRNFLMAKSNGSHNANDDIIAGLCRVVEYLLSEILDLATSSAMDSHRYIIMPCDVRYSVNFDYELRGQLGYSRFFWYGPQPASDEHGGVEQESDCVTRRITKDIK